MSLFEAQVQRLRTRLNAAAGTPVERSRAKLPAAQARAGLILKNEALCELGGPQHAGALVLVYSNAAAQDRALRIGRSLSEIAGRQVDFALVVVLGGERLDAETFYQCSLRFPRLADHPGWMVKTDKARIWVRVGAGEAEDRLETAAASLIARIHAAFEAVESVELYFIVDDKALTEELVPQAEQCQSILRDVKTGVWKERGFDYQSCELAGHCGNCSDKKTCASVRKIQAKVKLVRKTQNRTKEE